MVNDRNQCRTMCLDWIVLASQEILICNKNLNNLSQIDSITPRLCGHEAKKEQDKFTQVLLPKELHSDLLAVEERTCFAGENLKVAFLFACCCLRINSDE